MYFEGVGTLPYEPPPPELKPFFHRKYATAFRSMDTSGDGCLRRNDFLAWTDRTSKPITDLDKKKEFVMRHMQIYDDFALFGRQSINEEQYGNEFMKLAFCDAESRKLHMTNFRKYIPDYFALGDTNKDGYIDYNEFCAVPATFDLPLDTTKIVFDTVDANKDGLISLDEYSYASISFFFHSGPDDPLSLLLGNLVDSPK